MRIVSVLLAAALLAGAPRASAQTASELFAEGAAAHDRGDLEQARAKYAASFATHQAPETAANLGVVEGLLGRHREAAGHLAFALARYRDQGDETKRRRMAEELSRVLGYVGELRIEAPEGARITVDGAAVGTAPLVIPVYVEPGLHRVAASLEGGSSPPVEVEVDAGEARDVRLGARHAAETPGPLAPRIDRAPPRAPTEPQTALDPVLIVGGAGLTAVGVGLGVAFAFASEGDDGLDTASIVSFVGGGAAALATVAYVVVVGTAGGGGDAAALRMGPAATPRGAGIAAAGTF